ncbi:MAG: hypothetical protein AVDCRST_MAG49-3390 [uncultured Thermomicrobiales bacterium]|uniref:Xylose isomerase-like TIM barrel domain-containing protein n=1 Tax=uncultured Thermomicrobiales bacterium TaxID=1645740 RepID=A0A6J4V7B7_9BACT|nr:MAG: hypothetical protein AVDCRST_MAG49-3390 [uncultured Thermomicrobiales bacterium]
MSPPSDRASAAGGPLRLGLSSGALYPHVPTEVVPEVAATLGIGDLELMLQSAGEYDPAFARVLRTALGDAGVRAHAVHTRTALHPVVDPYPRRIAEGRAMFDRAIALCVEVGAGVLVWHGPTRRELALEPDAVQDRLPEVAAELAAACGAAGITLAVENVSWCALASVRDVAAFAAAVVPILTPGARLGFAFDPFQSAEADANPFMVLAAMGDRVVDVHLSDRRAADPAHRHLPPGDGDLPWPALVRAVAGVYAGPLVIEAPLGPDPAATLARIRGRLDPLLPRPQDLAEHAGAPAASDAACAGPLPPGVRDGIDLFNAGAFYACHEAIEHEWHAERGPIRRLYQGILQIGVGLHHAERGNHRGAVLLLGDGIAKVAAFAPGCRGVDTVRLVAESRAYLAAMRRLGLDDLTGGKDGLLARVGAPPRVHRLHTAIDGGPDELGAPTVIGEPPLP